MRSFVFILSVFSLSLGLSQDFKKLKKLTSSNPDSAIVLLSEYTVAQEDTTKAIAHQLIGNAFYFRSIYDSAISHYQHSNALLDSTNNVQLSWMARNYNNVGVCYNFLMNLEVAHTNHRKALAIREKLSDPMASSSYNNLGLILFDLEDYDGALDYFLKSYNAKIEFRQFSKLSTTIRNISRVFSDLRQYDSAIHYLEIGLVHLDSVPNTRELASFYTNLGQNYEAAKEFDQAIFYGKKGFHLKKTLTDNYGLINSGLNLSVAYRKKGQYLIAEKYLDSLDVLVPNLQDYSNAHFIYSSRAYNSFALSNFKEAYEYLLLARRFSDSLTHETNSRLLLDLEEKYQTEQKELEIAQLSSDNKIQQLQAERDAQMRIILLVGLVALFIIAILLYSRSRTKAKINALLDAKNQELAAINKTKDRLFSIISHDLKSPLSSFHLITQSLANNIDALDKSQLREYLESLRDSSANVRDMMDNLLKWALAQTDQLGYKMESVEVGKLLEGVVSQMDVVSNTKSILIKTNLDQDLKLQGDASFLEIVIRNLLSNSLKFTEPGKIISLSTKAQGDMAVLEVTDEGVGMEQEEIDKLLSGEILGAEIQNSSEKGTGLGITLVNELVRKMNGKLEVTSARGKGTTFKLSFEKAA